MNCPHCKYGEVEVYRLTISNGSQVATERCNVCGRVPNRSRPFLPKKDIPNFESLPLFDDFTADAPPVKCWVVRTKALNTTITRPVICSRTLNYG